MNITRSTVYDNLHRYSSLYNYFHCEIDYLIQVQKYSDLLDNIMIKRDDGIKLMPELYTLLPEQVNRIGFVFFV